MMKGRNSDYLNRFQMFLSYCLVQRTEVTLLATDCSKYEQQRVKSTIKSTLYKVSSFTVYRPLVDILVDDTTLSELLPPPPQSATCPSILNPF